MKPKRTLSARVKTLALALLGAAAVYMLTPMAANQFGSVSPAAERREVADLRVTALDGSRWTLEGQRGNVVLLNFWATWCPPCRIETPALVTLHAKYAGRGFTVAGVTMDDDPGSVVPAFVERYGVRYPVLVPQGEIHVDALPTSYLIDRSGRVARTYVGLVTERTLRNDIEAVLAEPDAAYTPAPSASSPAALK